MKYEHQFISNLKITFSSQTIKQTQYFIHHSNYICNYINQNFPYAHTEKYKSNEMYKK